MTRDLDTFELEAIETARQGRAALCNYVGMGGCACVCDLVIVPAVTGAVVLLSERADNCGTSITKWYEKLATEIVRLQVGDLRAETIRWMERYPADQRVGAHETIDRVILQWDGQVFSSPKWEYVAPPAEAYA